MTTVPMGGGKIIFGGLYYGERGFDLCINLPIQKDD